MNALLLLTVLEGPFASTQPKAQVFSANVRLVLLEMEGKVEMAALVRNHTMHLNVLAVTYM